MVKPHRFLLAPLQQLSQSRQRTASLVAVLVWHGFLPMSGAPRQRPVERGSMIKPEEIGIEAVVII